MGLSIDHEKVIRHIAAEIVIAQICKKDFASVDIDMLSDALAMLKEQAWNVLTEDADGVIHGFPGDDGQYLMTDGKDIWIDELVDGVDDGIILDSGRDIREITAWMYMPELPKHERR